MSLPREEYPRPILVREDWLNLNGLWQFCEDKKNEGMKGRWFESKIPATSVINVPFPVESEASGIHNIEPASIVWYERTVELPENWQQRVVLRIGAADHWTRVFVNGLEVGQHRGGYSPIALDIEHALLPGTNRITLRIEDSLSWTQPRGKQAGTTRWPIDYDSVTGIWQTVWIEPLASVSIESTFPIYSVAMSELVYTTCFSRQVEGKLTVELSFAGELIATQSVPTQLRSEVRTKFQIEDPKLWSPDSPHLYDVRLTLEDEHTGEVDVATSYVGLREVSVLDGNLCLNGVPIYLRGVLDQGYFPEGWYTALSDNDLKKDVELTKAMGLNCARKHQKAEDPRYLYWADKLGLMVWAEMPSGKIFSTELVETLSQEWVALVKRDRCHPSVVTWVPFNESWGVWHQSERPEQRAFVEGIVGLTKALDQSRPVVGNDGWEFSSGDLWTLHLYFSDKEVNVRLNELIENPAASVTGETGKGERIGALPGVSVDGLPILLTECGGVGFGQYSEEDFSYGELPSSVAEFERDVRRIAEMIDSGNVLQGFVWTQLTDIQQEVNGLLYFDRTPKLPIESFKEIFSSIGSTNEN